MPGISYVILAAVCLSLHLVALKFLGHLPSTLVTVSFYTVGLLVLLMLYMLENPHIATQDFWLNPKILVLILIAGVNIALVDYFFMNALNAGMSITMLTPLFLAGSTTLVAVIGMLLLGEAVTLTKLVGIAAAITGIFLINKG